MPRSRVFTIPASVPFLPTLIRALVDGRLVPGFPAGDDPLALAAATLFLPNRRACRLARDLFLDALATDAAVLPRIVPIGDIDEEDLAFAETAAPAADAVALPPALDGLERRLLLTRLVATWARSPDIGGAPGAPLVAGTPAAALALADDLGRLMDDMTTRRVAWERLDGLVPDNVDKYWQLTLEFLNIARQRWPEILALHGAIEPAARRDRLIAAEAAWLAHHAGPVIAAGSTGSMPATATLLATIAALPQGAVILPGLDTDLDEPSWDLIGDDAATPAAGHPQFAMHGLLRRMHLRRDGVATLAPPAPHGRERFLSEALRPAAATEYWQARLQDAAFAAELDDALGQVAVVEAANADEEALAIAVALREAIEAPGRTVALITPDRALARRVLAALARWNVAVDDTGGEALADSPAGTFARLAASAALGGLAPAPLLALLKHPLCGLDAEGETVAALEQAVLRGPRPRAGSAGLAHALKSFRVQQPELHRRDPRRRLPAAALDAAEALVARLAAAVMPLENIGSGVRGLADLAARHRDAVAALGCVEALADRDGAALHDVFDEIAASPAAAGLMVAPGDYAELFGAVIADRALRRPDRPEVRVRIFGPLEARLQPLDRVVLGGLVEGTWPPETSSDPWLSRPMRHELGLDLPERRIGLSAHDFAQALGAPEVVLTRAAKVGGAPTVASRFTQRLATVAGKERWGQALARGSRYVALARALDAPARVKRIEQPAPTPPREARPTALAVTDIENWLRDPYTIYAKHVLRLTPLPAVDTPPGAADRGTVIHKAIGDFTEQFAQELPADSFAELIRLGRDSFAALDDYPEARAFWWPRFQRIARWFAGWESERRARIGVLYAEIRGEIPIPMGERVFRLSARADRIELLADGRFAILDYKTGSARTEKQVRTGLAPQLTLEAAILQRGGFPEIAAGASVAELVYVTLKGGEPAGDPCTIDFKEGTPDSQAAKALAALAALVARFEDEATPYRSLVHPMWTTHYGDYDHLARVKEWSETSGALDENGVPT